jgi:SPP1 gp7 family putative phage head morphogenesis protein
MVFNSMSDPTKTISLRRTFISSINRRFRELKTKIMKYIVVDNNLSPITINVFEYRNATEKYEKFMNWLKEQERLGILEMIVASVPYRNVPTNQPWINTFLWTAYQKGMVQSRIELRANGLTNVPSFAATAGQFVSSPLFHAPFHSEAVGLLFTRGFTDLKGITQTMDARISRVLAQGMSEGLGAEHIARNINREVDKIGMIRARTMARTEIVKAYNDAKMNDYDAMEDVIGEEILVQWWTAQDERVRDPRHTSRHGKIYQKKDARRLVGEPNCRCTLLPYLVSVKGEVQNNQWGPINPLGGR